MNFEILEHIVLNYELENLQNFTKTRMGLRFLYVFHARKEHSVGAGWSLDRIQLVGWLVCWIGELAGRV